MVLKSINGGKGDKKSTNDEKVVPISKAANLNQDIIKALEEHLKNAKEGKIDSICIISTNTDNTINFATVLTENGNTSVPELIGLLEMAKTGILNDFVMD